MPSTCYAKREGVAAFALGDETRPSPKQRARDALSDLRTHVRSWPQASERGVRAVPLFSGVGESVFSQLRDAWPSGSPPRAAKVLFRFFDEASNSREMISELADLIAKRRPREIDFYLSAEDLPEGKTRVLAPLALVRAAHDLGNVKAFEVSLEQGGELRSLHARVFSLSNDEWRLYLVGSSNFTRAGFGLNNKAANLEANLAYLVRRRDVESNALEQVWPEVMRELDVNDSRLLWEPTFGEEGEGETAVALPRPFREALYDAGSKPQRLTLSLGDPGV